MKEHKDVKIIDSSFEIGLTKLIDKEVKEIRGYITSDFEDPTFKMTTIEFKDGTFLGCEGEHDSPYLVSYGVEDSPIFCKEYTEELLENIQKTDPDYEEE